MHVSPKVDKRRGKVYGPYWVLERSVRDGEKVGKRLCGYVGKADNRAEAYKLARQKGLLCGAHGCGKAPTEEIIPYLLCPAHAEDYRLL